MPGNRMPSGPRDTTLAIFSETVRLCLTSAVSAVLIVAGETTDDVDSGQPEYFFYVVRVVAKRREPVDTISFRNGVSSLISCRAVEQD